MYHRILVPVDGSSTSMQGLAQAIRWAGLSGARLRLMHVLDALQYATGFEPAAVYCNEVIPEMKQCGEALLGSAQKCAQRSHVESDTVLVESVGGARLAEQVVEQARVFGADLIVIGTHGRRGVDRALLGSDAEQIVRIAPVPVLLVRGKDAPAGEKLPDNGAGALCRLILVPIDGSDTSNRGLDEAIDVAKATGARLRLMHVVDELGFSTGFEIYSAETIALLKEGGENILAAGRARALARGVSAETFLSESVGQRASDLIVEEARASQADLLVIGTHGRRGVGRLLIGSDAERVVRESPVPVLLVRARAASAAPEAVAAVEAAA